MRPSQGGDPVLPRTSTFGGGAGGYCGSYDSLQRDVSTDYDGSDDYFNQVKSFFFAPPEAVPYADELGNKYRIPPVTMIPKPSWMRLFGCGGLTVKTMTSSQIFQSSSLVGRSFDKEIVAQF